ncbi:four helix bundle suffix domain-containing protein [Capnocytophaga sp. HP1101]
MYARSEKIFTGYKKLILKTNDEELANFCITLINQTTYLLKRLIEKQQIMFLEQGGIREQMYQARKEFRE